MVEDAQAEDEVEHAQAGLGQLVEVENAIADPRDQLLLEFQEIGHLHAIDGRHCGAVALRLEAEPPVPGADVEHPLAGQIRRNGKSRVSLAQPLDLAEALDPGPVRQFETVVPALFGKFLAEVLAPAGFMHMHRLTQARQPIILEVTSMSTPFQIVVCGSFVPDPLQTLEPVTGPAGPSLKNEMMLPAVLDPWAGHALFKAANLARKTPGSKVWLVSLGPKAKLQQVMMTVAQKVPSELVAPDGPASGFTAAIAAIPGLDRARLLVFGGWESASRGAGSTLQMVGERLGIAEQFQGVDQVTVGEDGSLEI